MPSSGKQKPNIEVLVDADAIAKRCLELFISAVNKALKSKKCFNLAISGGHTPTKFYKLLAKTPDAADWSKIHVFWADERYIPADSPLSNYRLAADIFLHKIPIPQTNIHPIPTDFEDIEEARREYEKKIREVFGLKADQLPRFDLIILGMGTDGHTASLFPNSNTPSNESDIACSVYASKEKMPNPHVKRITLTLPALRAASKLIILVTGPDKSQILKDVLNSPPGERRYPIQYLWPAIDRTYWLVDKEAAKLL